MQLREIKAYIRRSRIDSVIHKLRTMGIKSMSVIAVDGVGGLASPSDDRMSVEYASHYSRVYKLELVCRPKDEDVIVGLIRNEAHTGEAGDGVIFVSDVKRAVKIRTGKEGTMTLEAVTPHGKEPT
jgi:nitrogen regulatory protein P-II 1